MELVLEFFHQNQKSVYDKMGRLMESQLKNWISKLTIENADCNASS